MHSINIDTIGLIAAAAGAGGCLAVILVITLQAAPRFVWWRFVWWLFAAGVVGAALAWR